MSTVPAGGTTVSAGAMQIAAWFTLAGGLLGGLGSAVRAWFAIKEYQDLVQQAQVPDLLKTALRFTIGGLTSFRIVGSLAGMVSLGLALLLVTPVQAVRKGLKAAVAEAASLAKDFLSLVKEDFQELPLVALFRAQRKVAQNLALIRASGEDEARRLGELANQAFSWSMVLLGAVLVSIGSAIKLYWAYQ